jgi:hypothetical protein
MESLTGIARAGADIILTYFATRAWPGFSPWSSRMTGPRADLVRPRRRVMPGRGQLAGSCLQGGRGDPPFIASRHGRTSRPRTGIADRLHRLVGSPDPRATPDPVDRGRRRDGARTGHLVRGPDRRRGGARRADRRLVPSVEVVRMVNSAPRRPPRRSGWPGPPPAGRGSSSSRAATTATPTPSW